MAATLRDRKRERTRQALVEAATELFESRGYDETTVADIAAAADIGTRTFFSYFASKEEVLFPQADARVQAAIDAIAARKPSDRPATVLLRALTSADQDGEMVDRLAALRLRLSQTVPSVRGRGFQLQLEAQREIATHLHRAWPDELDEVTACSLVGAFVGAITGALQVLLEDPAVMTDRQKLSARLRKATEAALRPWLE